MLTAPPINSPVKITVEEVPVKRMDRPRATETERGRAFETDRRKSAKNMEMPLKKIKCNNTFYYL